jgi:hypothetical protein
MPARGDEDDLKTIPFEVAKPTMSPGELLKCSMEVVLGQEVAPFRHFCAPCRQRARLNLLTEAIQLTNRKCFVGFKTIRQNFPDSKLSHSSVVRRLWFDDVLAGQKRCTGNILFASMFNPQCYLSLLKQKKI